MVQVIPKEGQRVISTFAFLTGLKGVIVKAHESFAVIKWDDPKHGITSEDYSVIAPDSVVGF